MTPVVNVVIHCVVILPYYQRNTLAVIIIDKEQRACRLIVNSRMSTNAGNRVPLKQINTTPYVLRVGLFDMRTVQCKDV